MNEPHEEKKEDAVIIEDKSSKKQRKPVKSFFAGFLGGIVAIAIVIVLIMTNVLPFEITTASSNVSHNNTTEKPEIPKTVNMNNETTDLSNVSKAVVGVLNIQQQSVWSPSEEAGTGSGIIYKKSNNKAYIVTNNHVIQNAKEIQIVLYNEKRIHAKLVGTDALSDLAVLEVDSKDIENVAELGSSKNLTVGETVIAIGNPLNMNLAGTVTKGIISGLNRSVPIDTNGDDSPDWITEVIQTDAAINPGNSGGALVSHDGKVIGINSMKIAQREVEGIGFSIPIDTALPIIEQLETKGKVERPFLGIQMIDISNVPVQNLNELSLPSKIEVGVVITNVEAGSPADKAGLEQFDTIVQMNDQKIESSLDLKTFLYKQVSPHDKVNVTIYRGKNKLTKSIKLTALNIN